MRKFRREWVVYGVAAAALAFATSAVLTSQPKAERKAPVGAVSTAPFPGAILATGVVEPSSQTIVVAPDLDGVIAEIHVKAGQKVHAGDPLFSLNDRGLKAASEQSAARFARAETMIKLRKAEHRAAESDAAAKRLIAARLRNRVERYRTIAETISAEEFDKMTTEAETAVFAYRAAEQAAISAGAAAEAAIQEAELARAEHAGAEADLARTVMRAPIEASVLSIDARVGEAVRASDRRPASVTIGAIDTLIARVQIDETEVARFRKDAQAAAFLRGQEGAPIELRLQSIDPMLKPKSDFRDLSSEFVDARVLEARYRINPAARGIYVGQLLDVYIDAPQSAPQSGEGEATPREFRFTPGAPEEPSSALPPAKLSVLIDAREAEGPVALRP